LENIYKYFQFFNEINEIYLKTWTGSNDMILNIQHLNSLG